MTTNGELHTYHVRRPTCPWCQAKAPRLEVECSGQPAASFRVSIECYHCGHVFEVLRVTNGNGVSVTMPNHGGSASRKGAE